MVANPSDGDAPGHTRRLSGPLPAMRRRLKKASLKILRPRQILRPNELFQTLPPSSRFHPT